MRFYTDEEIKDLCKFFNEEYLKDGYHDNLFFTSPLSEEDLRTTKTIKFKDFKKKYKLNIGDDTYEPFMDMLNLDKTGVNPEKADHNTYNPDDLRYPLIVLGFSYLKDEKHVDMIHFLELQYTLEHYDDEDLEVIVIDKMEKPFDKGLLDRVADYYGIDDYDYSLYA